MSVHYIKYLSFAYISAVELVQPCPELSQHTYTTIAISEYKSNVITISRVKEELSYDSGAVGRKLSYHELKRIRVPF